MADQVAQRFSSGAAEASVRNLPRRFTSYGFAGAG